MNFRKDRMFRTVFFGLGTAALLWVCGCNAGMEPEGPSPDQIKAKMAAMPIDQQIALIKNSPMPKAEKAQKIAELQAKGTSTAPAK